MRGFFKSPKTKYCISILFASPILYFLTFKWFSVINYSDVGDSQQIISSTTFGDSNNIIDFVKSFFEFLSKLGYTETAALFGGHLVFWTICILMLFATIAAFIVVFAILNFILECFNKRSKILRFFYDLLILFLIIFQITLFGLLVAYTSVNSHTEIILGLGAYLIAASIIIVSLFSSLNSFLRMFFILFSILIILFCVPSLISVLNNSGTKGFIV